MRVGVVSWLYPSRRNPVNGTFVREELEHLAAFAEIRLIAPLHNQYWFGEIHSETSVAGYPVIRPITWLFPSWFFQRRSPAAMAGALSRSRGFFSGCDLVHAHNAFPEAVAVVRAFGREFPVVVTVHGSDVNLLIGRRTLRAVHHAVGADGRFGSQAIRPPAAQSAAPLEVRLVQHRACMASRGQPPLGSREQSV